MAVVLVLLGVAASLIELAQRRGGARSATRQPSSPGLRGWLLPLALAVAVVAVLFAEGPTAVWRHSGIGAGRAPREVFASANQLRAWEKSGRRVIFWERDGVESSVALAAEDNGYAFIVNGKSDGSARGDAGTQVMLGLLGAFRHPKPARGLVIGLGTGSSAGWLAAIPSMERVDVVELEPVVLDVARASTPVNHGAMTNPKLHVTVGDARETLLTSRDRYDVIASEPSNPFRAGVASLFTIEYYQAARARLTEDGVFAQWVQGYEIDAPTLRTIYATMAAVFPQVETWQSAQSDLVLLGTARPGRYNAAALRARIAEEPFKSAMASTWRAVDINGVLAHFLATDAVARAFAASARVEINTDDRNIVEFGLARSVGSGALLVAQIRDLAREMGASRPPSTVTPASTARPADGRANAVERGPATRPAARLAGGRAGADAGGATIRPETCRGRATSGAAPERGPAIRGSSRWPPTSKPMRARTRRCRSSNSCAATSRPKPTPSSRRCGCASRGSRNRRPHSRPPMSGCATIRGRSR